MKSKNVFLLIALMLVTSIFCSSCIIVHDWDDEYVYTAKSNLDDYEHCYGTITETGFNFSDTDTKYKFDDVDRRIYKDVERKYMTRTEVYNYMYNKLSNKNNIDECMDMFYSNRHIVIDIRNGNIVYSISK